MVEEDVSATIAKLSSRKRFHEIRDKFFKLTSLPFCMFIVKKIIEKQDPVIFTDFKLYDKEKMDYIVKINSARLKVGETGVGIILPETVNEIKDIIKETIIKLSIPFQPSAIFDEKTFYNVIKLSSLPYEERKKYNPYIKQFTDDHKLFIPEIDFNKTDLDYNFILQSDMKFIYNPDLPLDDVYDTNGIKIQHVIMKVVDIIDSKINYPVQAEATCPTCRIRKNIFVYFHNIGDNICNEIPSNGLGRPCRGRLTIQKETLIIPKDLYQYQVKFATKKGNDYTFTDHYLMSSFTPLHCGMYKAQVIRHQEDDVDGYILSATKDINNYDYILPSTNKYLPALYPTKYDNLELIRLYQQLQHFFKKVLNYNFTNQGILAGISITTQLLAKLFDYSNAIHLFLIGDKSIGKTFLMENLPQFFFYDIAPTENSADLSRARYVGGCIKVNSRKVYKGLLPTFDVVKLDEYGNLFQRVANGWEAKELHKLNKQYLLSPFVVVGKGEGGQFERKGIVIACSNFNGEYLKYYQLEVKKEYEKLQSEGKEIIPFDITIPSYRSLEYYHFNTSLQKAHMMVREEFNKRKTHFMLPCELPDLDRFFFLFLIESLVEDEKRLNLSEENNIISDQKLLELISYKVDVDIFRKNVLDNYPEVEVSNEFFKQLDEFVNGELKTLNPNIHRESRHKDLYRAVAKTIARLEQTTEFNQKVKDTLTLLFRFVGQPISKHTLDTGEPVVYDTKIIISDTKDDGGIKW